MEFLKDIIEKAGIKSKEDVGKMINNPEALKTSQLELLGREDLHIDDEDRIYESLVDYKNAIINVSRLRIRDSRKIHFTNCILNGDLEVSQHSESIEIVMDYCIVLGKLNLGYLDKGDNNTVELVSVNCRELLTIGCKLKSIDLITCNIGHFSVYDCKIEEMRTFQNRIEFFSTTNSLFKSINFDYEQTNLKNLLSDSKSESYKKIINSIDLFSFIEKIDYEGMSAKSKRGKYIDTIDFYKNKTSISSNKEAYSILKQAEAINSQENKIAQFIVRIFGGFSKPSRVLIVGFLVIILFAIYYLLPISEFIARNNEVPDSLDLFDAIYFSGITFTTIGYGDIIPINFTRLVSVIEGILGIIIGGIFVVSLVRKYID